jgi:hypothetical protein
VKNGALLRQASSRFAFITVENNLRFQQDLTQIALRIVVIRAISYDRSDLLPLVPAVLETMSPGTVTEIGG